MIWVHVQMSTLLLAYAVADPTRSKNEYERPDKPGGCPLPIVQCFVYAVVAKTRPALVQIDERLTQIPHKQLARPLDERDNFPNKEQVQGNPIPKRSLHLERKAHLPQVYPLRDIREDRPAYRQQQHQTNPRPNYASRQTQRHPNADYGQQNERFRGREQPFGYEGRGENQLRSLDRYPSGQPEHLVQHTAPTDAQYQPKPTAYLQRSSQPRFDNENHEIHHPESNYQPRPQLRHQPHLESQNSPGYDRNEHKQPFHPPQQQNFNAIPRPPTRVGQKSNPYKVEIDPRDAGLGTVRKGDPGAGVAGPYSFFIPADHILQEALLAGAKHPHNQRFLRDKPESQNYDTRDSPQHEQNPNPHPNNYPQNQHNHHDHRPSDHHSHGPPNHHSLPQNHHHHSPQPNHQPSAHRKYDPHGEHDPANHLAPFSIAPNSLLNPDNRLGIHDLQDLPDPEVYKPEPLRSPPFRSSLPRRRERQYEREQPYDHYDRQPQHENHHGHPPHGHRYPNNDNHPRDDNSHLHHEHHPVHHSNEHRRREQDHSHASHDRDPHYRPSHQHQHHPDHRRDGYADDRYDPDDHHDHHDEDAHNDHNPSYDDYSHRPSHSHPRRSHSHPRRHDSHEEDHSDQISSESLPPLPHPAYPPKPPTKSPNHQYSAPPNRSSHSSSEIDNSGMYDDSSDMSMSKEKREIGSSNVEDDDNQDSKESGSSSMESSKSGESQSNDGRKDEELGHKVDTKDSSLPFHPEFGFPNYAKGSNFFFRVPKRKLEKYEQATKTE